MSNPMTVQDNIIEFLKNDKTAVVTFSQGKYITKIKKLAEKYPDECKIVAENNDGSILAHIPVNWVKISRIKREISEEQRLQSAERLRNYRRNHTE